MRKLHLVGLTADRKGLIFTARKGSQTGGYVVPLEDDFLDAIAEAQRRRNGTRATTRRTDEPRVGSGSGSVARRSNLTPREIQARLRAGRSAEAVADEAEVDVEWVERFAVPIFAEQAQVVELARSLVYAKPRGGDSDAPLDEAVAWNLLDRGITLLKDDFAASWGAHQLHDQVWLVRFEYRARGRLQHAEWEVDVRTGELTARNRLAGELAYVEKGRPRTQAAGVPGADEDEAGGTERAVEAAAVPAAAVATELEPEEDVADADEVADFAAAEKSTDADEAPAEAAEAPDVEEADAVEEVDAVETAQAAEAAEVPAEVPDAEADRERPLQAVADGTPATEPDLTPAPTARKKRSRATKASKAEPAGAAPAPGKPEPASAQAATAEPALPGTKPPARALSRSGRRPWYAADSGPPLTEPVRPPAKNRTDRAATTIATKGKVARGASAQAGPAPDPDGTRPAKPPAARKSQSKTPAGSKTPATAGGAKPPQGGTEAPPPVATPGGAGVRMAVAKVTTARVAASRALVARAVTSQPPAVHAPPPPPVSPLGRQRPGQQARPTLSPERQAPPRPAPERKTADRPAPERQVIDSSPVPPAGGAAAESARPAVRRPPPPSAAAPPSAAPPAAERRPAPRTEAPDPYVPFADQEATGRFRILPADDPGSDGQDDEYAPPPPTVRPFTPRPAPTGPVRVNSRSEGYGGEDDDGAWGDVGNVGGSTAYDSRPTISASPAGDWRPLAEPPKRRSSGGAPPPPGIDEPRSRRRKRRSRPS